MLPILLPYLFLTIIYYYTAVIAVSYSVPLCDAGEGQYWAPASALRQRSGSEAPADACQRTPRQSRYYRQFFPLCDIGQCAATATTVALLILLKLFLQTTVTKY